MLTVTFVLNALIGHHLEMLTLTFTLNTLIGQLTSHRIKSFPYLQPATEYDGKVMFLLCVSVHRGARPPGQGPREGRPGQGPGGPPGQGLGGPPRSSSGAPSGQGLGQGPGGPGGGGAPPPPPCQG